VNTDFQSDQWNQVRALAQKFPSSGKVVDQILESLRKEGIDFSRDLQPALGPELDVVLLHLPSDGESPQVVGMTQPKDEAKFQELLKKGDTGTKTVVESYQGWTIFSDTQASLDAFKAARGGGALSDATDFGDALKELDHDAALKVWVDGKPLTGLFANLGPSEQQAIQGLTQSQGTLLWLGAEVYAAEDGVHANIASRSEGGPAQPDSFESTLVDDVPANALVFGSFNNLAQTFQQLRNTLGNANPELDRQIAQIESALGVSIDNDVLPLLSNEVAIWVGPGSPIPTVAIVAAVDDETKARQTLDKLGQAAAQALGGGAAAPTDVDIAGVAAKELALGQVSVFYAVFDAKAVISLGRDGIAKTKDPGDSLGSNDLFKQATDAAGMPDKTNGFVYVNLQDGVPLILDLAQLGGSQVPQEVRANLEPLKSVLFYADLSGDIDDVSAFVGIR